MREALFVEQSVGELVRVRPVLTGQTDPKADTQAGADCTQDSRACSHRTEHEQIAHRL